MSFSSELSTFAKKAEKNLDLVIQSASIELFGNVIKTTPVGNPSLWKSPAPKGYVGGRLRGNWFCSLNVPSNAATDMKDKAGQRTVGAMATIVAKFEGEGSIFLTNNLPYAERVEYGWSKQAPHGMVRTNISIFKDALRQKANEVSKR
jgi:hypothetical protein